MPVAPPPPPPIKNVPPAQKVPPVDPGVDPVVSPLEQSSGTNGDAASMAALVQIAGTAIRMADQTGDARIKRIADLALREVTNSGAVRDLVKIVAGQSVESTTAVNDTREADRERRQAEFQESIMHARAQRRQQNEANTRLLELLAKRLVQGEPEPNPNPDTES